MVELSIRSNHKPFPPWHAWNNAKIDKLGVTDVPSYVPLRLSKNTRSSYHNTLQVLRLVNHPWGPHRPSVKTHQIKAYRALLWWIVCLSTQAVRASGPKPHTFRRYPTLLRTTVGQLLYRTPTSLHHFVLVLPSAPPSRLPESGTLRISTSALFG